MAYISHSGNSNKSHYDWHILIVIILVLVSIVTFVVVKFVFPDIFSDTESLDTKTEQQTTVPLAEPVSDRPTINAQVKSATAEVKQASTSSKSGSVSSGQKSESSSSTASKSVGQTPASANDKSAAKPAAVNESLKCSESDRLAGLCS